MACCTSPAANSQCRRVCAVTLVTSFWGGVSGMSVRGFRWYLRGRTCSPFLPSTRSIAGVLDEKVSKSKRHGQLRCGLVLRISVMLLFYYSLYVLEQLI